MLYVLIAIILLRLSLSGIYNYLNPLIVQIYAKEINRPLPPEDISEIFETISEVGNMNETLYHLQTEKDLLSRNNKRNSDRYAMLSIIEKV